MEQTDIPETFELEVKSIPQQKVHKGQRFPLVLHTKEATSLKTGEEWVSWTTKEKDRLISLMTKYGAILFKGLPIKSPEDFDRFVKVFGYNPYPYVGGAAPRTVITGNVYTANESPLDKPIPFHHEVPMVPDPPTVLFFYCEVPPKSGGQTPIVFSPEMYDTMLEKDPKFVERLEKEGIRYTRFLPDGDDTSSIVGRGWQSTYQANTRDEAEAAARKHGTAFEWTEDGYMRTTTTTLPAVRYDNRTGRKTWFNGMPTAWLGWQDKKNQRKRALTFPNGDYMEEESMHTMIDTLEELSVDFEWESGDICMVDNRQVLHGRRAGVGPRRVLASLCKD